MNKVAFEIEIKSLRHAVAHLRTLDLDELAGYCQAYGTPADCALIEAVAAVLPRLPPTHP